MAIILSINSGSSSVKVSVYRLTEPLSSPTQLADAQISGLTAFPTSLTYLRGSESTRNHELSDVSSNENAFSRILDHLVSDNGLPQISNKEDISYACHRVVHGGDLPNAHVIDEETYHRLEDLTDLAPLHNGSALAIVKSCIQELPNAKNIAYFDSSFHSTIPKAVSTYAIDPNVAQENKLRKYGFHGIS